MRRRFFARRFKDNCFGRCRDLRRKRKSLASLTVVIGLMRNSGKRRGFRTLCGIFADALSGGGFGYSSFVFMYAGALSGVLKEYFSGLTP